MGCSACTYPGGSGHQAGGDGLRHRVRRPKGVIPERFHTLGDRHAGDTIAESGAIQLDLFQRAGEGDAGNVIAVVKADGAGAWLPQPGAWVSP